ncbi:MAG TPA: protein kinase [Pyrinomonadaceae bacterium]|nr:protein kinase [Pyrinomonadaceae bacterium]
MSTPIPTGTMLGRYEIASQIGAGGMGEVYRALDTKLGRDVAVKVLLREFSADRERMRRFEQEAQAAGALNHPNVVSIHDVGELDGSPYVVSELLEGETLRERLDASALPPRKALDYAAQIARGLAAAHAKGIVHRDLKPENIFVTSDGRVKILDFGLAKLTERWGDAVAQTDVPTRLAHTEPGMVMGTVGYMSPEQLRGRAVDHRTDIFSFGAVLYEMLTGRRAFSGETPADTISAILKEDPPELSTASGMVAPALERVVRHCLEKSPEERFQSARDLSFDLESLAGASDINAPGAVAPRWWGRASARRKGRRALPLAAVAASLAAVALVAAASAYWAGKRAGKTAPPSYRQLTFRRGTVWNARFAPDGQTALYSATWGGNPLEVFSMRVEGVEPRPLGLAGAQLLSISSNGEMAILVNRQYLGQFTSRGTLARVPLDGGTPREVAEEVQEADWSPDGTQLAVVRWFEGGNRLEYPIGRVLYQTTGYLSDLRVSPRGDRVAFMEHSLQWDNRGWVATVDSGGNRKALAGEWVGQAGLAWSPSGEEVWFTASRAGETLSLYAVTLAGVERLVARAPVHLMLGDISRAGRALVSTIDTPSDIYGLPPGGMKEIDLSWLDSTLVEDLSADGRTFAFEYYGRGSSANYSAYVRRTDGSPAVQLGEGAPLAISPDGKWVLARLAAPPQLTLLPTGAGEVRRLERGNVEQFGDAGWFPDGRRIIFNGREPGGQTRCYAQEIEGGAARAVTPAGVAATSPALVSPDGRYVVAAGGQGRRALYPVGGGEPRPIPNLSDEDLIARFSEDGRSLLVYSRGQQPVRINRLDLSTGGKEPFREVAPADPSGILDAPRVFVTPDGKAYVYFMRRLLCDLHLVEGLK